jgi:hypothetical protein
VEELAPAAADVTDESAAVAEPEEGYVMTDAEAAEHAAVIRGVRAEILRRNGSSERTRVVAALRAGRRRIVDETLAGRALRQIDSNVE